MQERGTTKSRANALKREIVSTRSIETSASPEAVWDVLADLSTHRTWGAGDRKRGLRSLDAPAGTARVGTEFTSTGEDSMTQMTDRSVITEASRPSVFEFVTTSDAELKKRDGRTEMTVVHRYDVTPTATGSRIEATNRTTRASALPGLMKVLNVPGLRRLAVKDFESLVDASLVELGRLAEQRTPGR